MSEIENIREAEKSFLKVLEGQGRSFNTIKNYRTDLECFNHFLFTKQQHFRLSDFNHSKVQEYTSYINDKYDSENSKRRRVQALRLFFDYLVGKGSISENPIRKIPVSPKILEAPKPTPMLEVIKLYRYLQEQIAATQGLPHLIALRNMFLFHLIYGAGLKVSDIAKITRENILLSQDGYRILVHHPKRDAYTIPLSSQFAPFYTNYLKVLEEQMNKFDCQFPELLFNANPYRILAGGISPRGIELAFKDMREKIHIQLTPKSLRQSCIFRWLAEDVSRSTVKEWMGVTPAYSLGMYLKLLVDHPNDFQFLAMENFPLQ